MIDVALLIVHKYWRNYLTNITYLTTARHDDRSWRDNLVSIRILLGQRE